MTHSTDIHTLARWMAAEFSNQEQAFANPPLFAHIRVCIRPLPLEFLSGVSLFSEQAYDYMLNVPYRLRVLKLIAKEDYIELEHYTVKDDRRFYGASRDLDRLYTLTAEDVERMPGCSMIVKWTGNSFRGEVEPGKACKVVRNGQETYLANTFEIDADGLMSLDRGLDPVTDERVWGSIAGPFQFVRWQNFADEVRID